MFACGLAACRRIAATFGKLRPTARYLMSHGIFVSCRPADVFVSRPSPEPLLPPITVLKMTEELADLYRHLILGLGENPEREGLQNTPERAAKAMQILTRGYA